MEALQKIFQDMAEKGSKTDVIFSKAVFSAVRRKSQPVKKAVIRPVKLKEGIVYQLELHYEKKVMHENIQREHLSQKCRWLIVEYFKQANILTGTEQIQILASKPEKPKLIRSSAEKEAAPVLSHNKVKKYIIPNGEPCDFLIKLGVMDKDGQVFQRGYSKFRQINRYLEIVRDSLEYLPKYDDKPLKIIDFGCGKSYLTFALYHYLKLTKGIAVEIIGLDLKEDVINFCNKTAQELGYNEIKFIKGDIVDYSDDHADMVVTLHACDTATDYALINAVNWNAKVILSVPCCQHELFNQLKNPVLQPMFKHGILKERFTEIITDQIRGLKLESCGYDVSMIEFTSLEHTARNIMIKAVRTGKIHRSAMLKAEQEYMNIKREFNLEPIIDKLKNSMLEYKSIM